MLNPIKPPHNPGTIYIYIYIHIQAFTLSGGSYPVQLNKLCLPRWKAHIDATDVTDVVSTGCNQILWNHLLIHVGCSKPQSLIKHQFLIWQIWRRWNRIEKELRHRRRFCQHVAYWQHIFSIMLVTTDIWWIALRHHYNHNWHVNGPHGSGVLRGIEGIALLSVPQQIGTPRKCWGIQNAYWVEKLDTTQTSYYRIGY